MYVLFWDADPEWEGVCKMRNRVQLSLWSLLVVGYISLNFMIVTADAAPITFYFQGTITSIDPALSGSIDPSKGVSGAYTFESTTSDLLAANSTFGRYALSSATYNIGGLNYSATSAPGSSNVITVSNQPGPNFDRYDVAIQANISGPSPIGLTHDQFYFQFEKVGLFADDSLPTSPPSISSSQNVVSIRFAPGGRLLQGNLTSLSLALVPVPAAAWLFGSGLVAFWGFTKRKQRESAS